LLKASGLDRDKLPDLAPTDSVLGPLTCQAAEALGLTTEAMVIAGATDNSSSASAPGQCAITIRWQCSAPPATWLCTFPLRKQTTNFTMWTESAPVIYSWIVRIHNKEYRNVSKSPWNLSQ